MRALVVVNPHATGTTPRVRDVLATALAADLKVEVVETTHRGHAMELANQAVVDGLDLVVSLGGDGTVNEIVNGLLTEGPRAGLPTLAVVPGGCANVFARSLGLPADPIEAMGVLLAAQREGRTRTIGLGRADTRWFTFCAGLGIDAATVRRVERKRRTGRPVTPYQYVRAAVSEFYRATDRRNPPLTISRPDTPDICAHIGLVCNTAPWTYLGDRPVNPCPEADFDTGLDLFALTTARTVTTLRHLRQILASRPNPRGRALRGEHDLDQLTISAAGPIPFQVDGDYAGERASVTFQSVPYALRVLV